ncbi:aldose epimerase family protein [Carboxylicivirga linearis]|uniref:Aldose 1-epimerase n=1 Tax=Carboxylicivirga linearis TaxID=1628157 RepID=A0ABS5JY30_9BACT|nr:aldose epimerase family protein [Carboxylicivirga linearis]MBS2099788.1 galactose mutarotase [Carboxylicivirga linearis]
MKKLLFALTIASFFTACQCDKAKLDLIDANAFETTLNDKAIKLYSITNANGLTAQLTNYGARVVSLWVPDKEGTFADVSLGFRTGDEYLNNKENFYGATIGRYGNRIGKAQFVIEEDTFNIDMNDGENTLHGGAGGFFSKIWDVKPVGTNSLEFTYTSVDGEQGYPGNVDVKVVFELTDKNELKIEYFASTDKTTHVNLTNHTYFNLGGEAAGTINDHLLMINADAFTPVDGGLIPTGELAPVEGTPFDFRKATAIGDRVNADDEQLRLGGGYDHNWVLNQAVDGLTLAATLKEPVSGRVMDVYTNEPGIQFYGGNFIDNKDMGKYGKTLNYREALCLETQHFPDTPNKPDFPSTLLNPGEDYYSICVYAFKAE